MYNELYVVHNGIVGNTLCWWRRGCSGYTTKLEEAHKFSLKEIESLSWRDEDKPVRLVDAMAAARLTVNVSDLIFPSKPNEKAPSILSGAS